MREIKFRGKDKKTNKWVYGGFHKHQIYTPSPIVPKDEESPKTEYYYLIIKSGFSDWNMPKPIETFEVIPETVGQYTGKKDIDGIEIYKGDIVKACYDIPEIYVIGDKEDNGVIGEVIYYEKFASYEVKTKDLQPTFSCFDRFEVLGNIYENPELLEGKDERV